MNLLMSGFIFFAFLGLVAEGTTFTLKNGESFEGECVSQSDLEVAVKTPYGTVTILRKDLRPEGETPKALPKSNLPRKKERGETVFPADERDSTQSGPQQNDPQLLNWLHDRINPKTGLLESYFPSAQEVLKNQAALYDQALAGITFLRYGFQPEARSVADFFVAHWRPEGFANFYHAGSGYPGLEKISHLGPNAWLGIFLLHLFESTRDARYLSLAESILQWTLGLKTLSGGSAMSNRDESAAPWSQVVSTENNLDLYALFREYLALVPKAPLKGTLGEKLKGLEAYWSACCVRENGTLVKIYRGRLKEGWDPVQAMDTYSWLVLAVGPEKLNSLGIAPSQVLQRMEEKFLTEDQGLRGFDFTDEEERGKMPRKAMVSMEWTCGAIAAYRHAGKSDSAKSEDYFAKADNFLKEMKKGIFFVREGRSAMAYATKADEQVFIKPPWWKTPQDGAHGNRAGSVASVCWYLLCKKGNPFVISEWRKK